MSRRKNLDSAHKVRLDMLVRAGAVSVEEARTIDAETIDRLFKLFCTTEEL